jgi:hypothetical protein
MLEAGEMPDPSSPRCRRQRLHVTVRTMMTLVLIVGAGLGWIVHRAQVQRQAVAVIREAGGSVIYESQLRTFSSGKPWWPKWVTEILGIDYFDDVNTVYLEFKESDLAPELVHIGRLSRLDMLSLTASRVTDAGLAPLANLGRLRSSISMGPRSRTLG